MGKHMGFAMQFGVNAEKTCNNRCLCLRSCVERVGSSSSLGADKRELLYYNC